MSERRSEMRTWAARSLSMRAMAVEFPEVSGHPNRLPFEGCLTLVDTPSDRAPSGARGHRVVLTRVAAEAALPSLLGMAVDFKAEWDGHDARQKCGIITSAELTGKRLMVEGFLFARDFPELEPKLRTGLAAAGETTRMGMSYELRSAGAIACFGTSPGGDGALDAEDEGGGYGVWDGVDDAASGADLFGE